MREIDQELFEAVREGNFDAILQCVQNGANINAKSDDNMTSLYLAMYYEHDDIVKDLIELGADIDTRDQHGRTPLLWYLFLYDFHKKQDIIGFLINNGANLNAVDKYGDGPLHYAVRTGIIEIIQLLIESGAKMDTRNNLGETPLHAAAHRFDYEMAVLLAESGANPYVKNKDGKTPIDIITNEEWKTRIMAAYSEYQNRIALGKVKETDCSIEPVTTPKHKMVI